MKKSDYLAMLENRHRYYFDVHRDYEIAGRRFDLYAECHVRTERTVLGYLLDSYESHDYRMVKYYEQASLQDIRHLYDWIASNYDIWVTPKDGHMCTFLALVVVLGKGVSQDLIRFIKRAKQSRYFALGLKGWYELRLLLVDLNEEKLWCNSSGNRIRMDFEMKAKPNGLLKKLLFWR